MNDMSHQEKTAWLMIVAYTVSFGPYLILMAMRPPQSQMPDLPTLGWFAVAATGLALVVGVGRLWLRFRYPVDARAPVDERDLAILRKSGRVAYFVLITGMIVVGCVMPFMATGWALVNAALLAIVLAELVASFLTVWGYRRGSDD
ncbi:MAG: hypothetical protein ACFHX7_04215 [Pseudomonadota bacterium]